MKEKAPALLHSRGDLFGPLTNNGGDEEFDCRKLSSLSLVMASRRTSCSGHRQAKAWFRGEQGCSCSVSSLLGRARETHSDSCVRHRGVFLLEKDVQFRHLKDSNFSEVMGLVLVHAKGSPTVASRALVHTMAAQQPTLPLLAGC